MDRTRGRAGRARTRTRALRNTHTHTPALEHACTLACACGRAHTWASACTPTHVTMCTYCPAARTPRARWRARAALPSPTAMAATAASTCGVWRGPRGGARTRAFRKRAQKARTARCSAAQPHHTRRAGPSGALGGAWVAARGSGRGVHAGGCARQRHRKTRGRSSSPALQRRVRQQGRERRELQRRPCRRRRRCRHAMARRLRRPRRRAQPPRQPRMVLAQLLLSSQSRARAVPRRARPCTCPCTQVRT